MLNALSAQGERVIMAVRSRWAARGFVIVGAAPQYYTRRFKMQALSTYTSRKFFVPFVLSCGTLFLDEVV